MSESLLNPNSFPPEPENAGKMASCLQRISALGLDVGRKRIGIAGCDGTGLIATGLMTLEHRSFPQTVESIRQVVQDRQVQVLVIGLPYTLDGGIGTQAKQVQKFARNLSAALQLPVEFVDERLTSVEAEELIQAEKRSPSQNKGLIDRKAAAIILQQWLDDRRRSPFLATEFPAKEFPAKEFPAKELPKTEVPATDPE